MKEGYVIRNQILPHFITATGRYFYKKNVRKVETFAEHFDIKEHIAELVYAIFPNRINKL